MNRGALFAALLLLGCRRHAAMPHAERSGGSASVFEQTVDAFSQPSSWLSEPHRKAFLLGKSFFDQEWLAAPASDSERDGLGPLFNGRSCARCHVKNGRGRPP